MYKAFGFAELKKTTDSFTNTITRETEKGGLVFIQQGAKLLGLFPDRDKSNTLWVNESIERYLDNRQALVGGERLWISPERNFYYENPRDYLGYHIPSEIDPGEYQCLDDAETIVFENVFSLLEYDRNKLFDNSIKRRSFTVIPDPYDTNLAYAGAAITDEIIIEDAEIQMCAWSIAQVYTIGPDAPGTALFPVKPGARVISYFDPIPHSRAETHENYARFKIDGAFSCKMGIRPEDIPDSMASISAYISRIPFTHETWSCIIKHSHDIPRSQQECVDMTKNDPNGFKAGIQAFNTDHGPSDMQAFLCGELGLQLNKGRVDSEKTISRGTHRLLSYCGSKSEMLELAKTALHLDEVPKIY